MSVNGINVIEHAINFHTLPDKIMDGLLRFCIQFIGKRLCFLHAGERLNVSIIIYIDVMLKIIKNAENIVIRSRCEPLRGCRLMHFLFRYFLMDRRRFHCFRRFLRFFRWFVQAMLHCIFI